MQAASRVSCRRAAVIAYITNLLLRTLPAMDSEDPGPAIIADLHSANRFDTVPRS